MDLNKEIRGKTVGQWMDEYPIMKEIADLKETAWINPGQIPFAEAVKNCPLTMDDVRDASDRLARFADYFKVAFPETRKNAKRIWDSFPPAAPKMCWISCAMPESILRLRSRSMRLSATLPIWCRE